MKTVEIRKKPMKQESYQNASEIHLLVFEVPCSYKIYIHIE